MTAASELESPEMGLSSLKRFLFLTSICFVLGQLGIATAAPFALPQNDTGTSIVSRRGTADSPINIEQAFLRINPTDHGPRLQLIAVVSFGHDMTTPLKIEVTGEKSSEITISSPQGWGEGMELETWKGRWDWSQLTQNESQTRAMLRVTFGETPKRLPSLTITSAAPRKPDPQSRSFRNHIELGRDPTSPNNTLASLDAPKENSILGLSELGVSGYLDKNLAAQYEISFNVTVPDGRRPEHFHKTLALRFGERYVPISWAAPNQPQESGRAQAMSNWGNDDILRIQTPHPLPKALSGGHYTTPMNFDLLVAMGEKSYIQPVRVNFGKASCIGALASFAR